MSKFPFQELEAAVFGRNPLLAEKLQPPLSDSFIHQRLQQAGVQGALDPIMQLYSWKNGTVMDTETALSETSFFPGLTYQLLDLETALQHLEELNQAAAYHPTLSKMAGRYVPLFWDGSTGYLVLDTTPSDHNRVMMFQMESE